MEKARFEKGLTSPKKASSESYRAFQTGGGADSIVALVLLEGWVESQPLGFLVLIVSMWRSRQRPSGPFLVPELGRTQSRWGPGSLH